MGVKISNLMFKKPTSFYSVNILVIPSYQALHWEPGTWG